MAENQTIYDVLIIGGGPAGLTASIYAARSNRKVMIIERALAGGKQSVTHRIENYPGTGKAGIKGLELSQLMEEQAKHLGVEFTFDNVLSVDLHTEHKKITTSYSGNFYGKIVIIATGCESKSLGIPGENKFRGKGISYCATCDGAFFKGKSVAVIGGGNSALEEAMFLAKLVGSVTLMHRRDQFRAEKFVQNKLENYDNLKVMLNIIPKEILGGTSVEKIMVKDVRTGDLQAVNVNGVFIYAGNSPNTNFITECDKNVHGFLFGDKNMHTNIPGVYVAGDVRVKHLRQIVTAVSDGAIAAVEADKFITNHLKG